MLTTHIYLNGQCKEAIEMYKEAFNATVKTLIEDSNAQFIVHAEIIIHNMLLMLNDFGNKDGFSKSGGYQLSVRFDNEADLKKAYFIMQDNSIVVEQMQGGINTMKIQVTPLVSLADQKIGISFSELPPAEKLTLRASMRLPWAKNVLFGSMATFITDENGVVDLARQAPIAGDYLNVNSMGLITSMKLVSGKLGEVGANISADHSIYVDIAAECGAEKAKTKIERLFMSPDVKTKMIYKPFVGAFYYSDNPNNKTVLLLGGSGGKLCSNLPMASLLASHGFNVLTVAYFSEAGLPKELVGIPLEYFDNVFAWLNENKYTKGKDLYLHCTSKGGELGLLLASMHPQIKKVTAVAPHAYCWQGTSFTKWSSSWTYQGRPLPCIPMKISTLLGNMIGCFIKNKPFGYAPYIIPFEAFGPIKIAPRLTFASGGTPQGNTEAQIDSWERMLKFFEVVSPQAYRCNGDALAFGSQRSGT